MNLYAGTSGYSYKEWKGHFYPEKIAPDQMLTYYSTKLPTVEINNTFYRLPKREQLEAWAQQVPPDFRFAIKASQKITHMRRLKNAGDETGYLMDAVTVLEKKLGVVFFQLPPNFKKDVERLAAFLALLPEGVPLAWEFRHESWFAEDVYEVLRARDASLCLADADDELEVPLVSTASWGYLRLRRPGYTPEELTTWHKWIHDQKWKDAYVFFKHEEAGIGAKLATQFLALE
jgi:uncharacterized protein YecE (DUF72 family)